MRDLYSGDLLHAAEDVQAHLILHFWLNREPVANFWNGSSWSRLRRSTLEALEYGVGMGEIIIVPGGDTSINSREWQSWRKAILTGVKSLSPSVSVQKNYHCDYWPKWPLKTWVTQRMLAVFLP